MMSNVNSTLYVYLLTLHPKTLQAYAFFYFAFYLKLCAKVLESWIIVYQKEPISSLITKTCLTHGFHF